MPSHNGGKPSETTGNGNLFPSFGSDCSEVIFPIPLLAPASHPRRLAVAFLGQLLSSSWHLFHLINYYNDIFLFVKKFFFYQHRINNLAHIFKQL